MIVLQLMHLTLNAGKTWKLLLATLKALLYEWSATKVSSTDFKVRTT